MSENAIKWLRENFEQQFSGDADEPRGGVLYSRYFIEVIDDHDEEYSCEGPQPEWALCLDEAWCWKPPHKEGFWYDMYDEVILSWPEGSLPEPQEDFTAGPESA